VSTPPARQLLLLAYEVSAAAKRDAAGRNPKRRVFAAEGARMCDAEARTPPLLPAWAGAADAAELDERLARVRAALEAEMAEVGAVARESSGGLRRRRWRSCGASSTWPKRYSSSASDHGS
jgi:hypothetical protein